LVDIDADLNALSDSPLLSFVVTQDAQYNNAISLVGVLNGIFMVLRIFAIVLTVVVLYSLGSLTFDERKRQYATLKVLGLHTTELRRLSIIDNASVTIIGLVIGIPSGLWFLSVYVDQFNTNLMNYATRITIESAIIALSLTVSASLLTTIMLGRRISSVNVVEALKGVD
jgi:putative ABC transport system permease protein